MHISDISVPVTCMRLMRKTHYMYMQMYIKTHSQIGCHVSLSVQRKSHIIPSCGEIELEGPSICGTPLTLQN